MRYVAERSGAVLDTKTGLREWCNTYIEAIILSSAKNKANKTKQVPNLSCALTIIARAEAAEIFMHADVSAWGAPGECHADVSRGEEERMKEACDEAERITGCSMKEIAAAAKEHGMEFNSPRWQSFVGRVYNNHYPF